MLHITIQEGEVYDSKHKIFIQVPETKLQLEHSLISLTKWESKWHKPFLSSNKNSAETLDYIRCMSIGKEVDPIVLKLLKSEDIKKIQAYIDDPMTATVIYHADNNKKRGLNKETITSEVLYYWIASNQIPFECEKWHLNRLLTLLEVFAVKNDKNNKMSKRETIQHNAKLNAIRRAAIKKSK